MTGAHFALALVFLFLNKQANQKKKVTGLQISLLTMFACGVYNKLTFS